MAFGLFSKSVNSIKYKKVGNTYKFSIVFSDIEILKFLALIIGTNKNVTIKGKKLDFDIDRNETTAGEFIDFAKSAGLLK